jgi:hypothetical protein
VGKKIKAKESGVIDQILRNGHFLPYLWDLERPFYSHFLATDPKTLYPFRNFISNFLSTFSQFSLSFLS